MPTWVVTPLLVAFAFAGSARADDAARVDWARGLLIAGGTGIADRHAPSPAVALGTSRRSADDAAKKLLAAKLPTLPVAGGGTLAGKLADQATKAKLDAIVDAAITVTADPETDGSWHVTLGVPLEAIRQALADPRALPPKGDADPPVVIVDGVTAKPAIGTQIDGRGAATIWVKDIPAWAKDAPHAAAKSSKGGAIELAKPDGGPATLYVLVGGK